ncbi:NmrA domain-containing protein [Fusarium sp. LHS14.1]|nr:NmrA domain-containing protein [Fusarium sp. LHS14.1]
MTTFQKITLIGKGLFGSVVLSELVNAGFEVTLLSRSERPDEVLPDGVRRVVVDYSDVDNLTKALSGQDAVVSTVSAEAALGQKLIIDAAIKAGVKRFVPSDFGSLTTDPAASHFLHHVNFVEIQKYLKSKSDEIEYTIFSIGAFTDFLINYGAFFDWKNKTAEVWGDGKTPLSTTSLSGSARAIVGALKNPEPTKNKNLSIHEHVVTQAQLLGLAKKYSSGVEWSVTTIEDPAAEFDRLEALVNEKPEMPNIFALLKATLVSGKYQAWYKNVDNDLVGVPVLTEKDLEATFAKAYGS